MKLERLLELSGQGELQSNETLQEASKPNPGKSIEYGEYLITMKKLQTLLQSKLFNELVKSGDQYTPGANMQSTIKPLKIALQDTITEFNKLRKAGNAEYKMK